MVLLRQYSSSLVSFAQQNGSSWHTWKPWFRSQADEWGGGEGGGVKVGEKSDWRYVGNGVSYRNNCFPKFINPVLVKKQAICVVEFYSLKQLYVSDEHFYMKVWKKNACKELQHCNEWNTHQKVSVSLRGVASTSVPFNSGIIGGGVGRSNPVVFFFSGIFCKNHILHFYLLVIMSIMKTWNLQKWGEVDVVSLA